MKVSVIFPVYRVEKYVELSLKSICNQKFTDFEIVIVNDGTSDNSMHIISLILQSYNVQFRIINQLNKGLPNARNTGLKAATGDYVCFIDSDDIICSDYLETQYNFVLKNNLQASFCKFELTDETNRFGSVVNDEVKTIIIDKDKLLKGFMVRKLKIHCCTLILNRDFLISNYLFFNEKLRFGEDVEFMWRVFPRLDSIGYVKAFMYKYLVRDNSIMTNQSSDKIMILRDVYSLTIAKLSLEFPNNIKYFDFLIARTMFGCIHSYSKQANNYHDFEKMIKMIEYEKYLRKLSTFPDLKIRIFADILNFNPRIFYLFFKNFSYLKRRV
ncbi:MAG TPA: glycosyltransferase [Candidatus Paceibacterota bacterium]